MEIVQDNQLLSLCREVEETFSQEEQNKYAGIIEDILDSELRAKDPDCIPDNYGFECVHASWKHRAKGFIHILKARIQAAAEVRGVV